MRVKYKRKQRKCACVCLPAGLCSQDLVYGVHADSHNVNNGLSGFGVGQAVDAQGLEGGGAASKTEKRERNIFTKKRWVTVPK